jgi:hypothetical protein
VRSRSGDRWLAITPQEADNGLGNPYTYETVVQRLEQTEFDVALLTWDGFLLASYPDAVEDLAPRRVLGVPGAAHPWETLMRVQVDGHLPREAMGEWGGE